jgi:hypothetical protein
MADRMKLRPPPAWLWTALMLALLIESARVFAGEVTCSEDGRYTHCSDSRTGDAVSTTEHGAGGYSHTWDANGHAYTTWDHNDLSHSWRTK